VIVSKTDFQTIRRLEGFPEPLHLEMETQFTPAYRNVHGTFNGLFVYTLKGRGCFREGKRVWELNPGVAYICCGHEPDVIYCYPEDGTAPWTFFWFSFKDNYAESILKSLVKNYGRIYHISEQHSLIKQMLALLASNQPLTFLAPHQAGELVFGTLNMLAEVFEQNAGNAGQSQLVQRLKLLVNKSLQDCISCEKLADKLGVSREHLSRVFKEHTGITPNEFILQRKILEACALLKETSLTCKEIAFRLGYESVSNFIRAFRKHQAVTPQEFRRQGALPHF